MERLERKLEQLDGRVDNIDITLARVDERLVVLQDTLDKHDAKSALAIEKADAAHSRIDTIGLTLLGKLRTVALWITGVGGAVYFLWDKVFS
jgi:hypothetical protein